MSNFAKLNNGVVEQVIAATQDVIDSGLFGDPAEWIHTRDDNLAAIGYFYDAEFNSFYPPAPYPSWVLNKTTWWWEAPIPRPSDNGTGDPKKWYVWDETVTNWVLVK